MAQDVYGASDLRRRTTEVLRIAQREPVLIVSPHGAVNIVERDRWRQAEKAEKYGRLVRDVLRAVDAARRGERHAAAYPAPVAWVRHLDARHLDAFVEEFLATLDAVEQGRQGWNEVDAVLHEWSETVAVAGDAELFALLTE